MGDLIKWGPDRMREIKSFGQSWTATESVVPSEHWHGTLYEACPNCGRQETEVELNAGVCVHCHPHAIEKTTTYCYAYLVD